MNLKEAFDKNGTDKSTKHKYHEIYEPLFEPNKDNEINFLEVGVWKGHGMAAFLDYFSKAEVYGVDIFTRITPEEVPIFNHERAHWVKGNSLEPSITSLLRSEFGVEFDYILDDGAHYPEANMLTFRHMSPLLKSGGLYIIEDVFPIERMTEKELKHPWLAKQPQKYNHLVNERFLTELDKSGMEIERFDNRKRSGEPDSYVITLRKK
jgi:SAM-dependent methyltransferase